MKSNVKFTANGVQLDGWLYRPRKKGPHPLIVMSHGFSAQKTMGLDDYARVFQKAGMACLVYDHRNFGASAGEPRQEIIPWEQIHDMREAVTYARTIQDIDPERIGLWGTSYSGGHVLVAGAIDRRVKCVVSQVPLVTGYGTLTRWVPSANMPGLLDKFVKDREARAAGEAPKRIKAIHEGTEAAEWLKVVDKNGEYPNEITQRSMEGLLEYEPQAFIHRIGPTPLLMIIAAQDTTTPTDTQLTAFNQARDPKKLVVLDCTHYDPYTTKLKEASTAAADWFSTHLMKH